VTFSKPPFFPSGILLLFFAVVSIGAAAQRSDAQLRELVQQFREDPRGPYQDIRWFCSDGTTREARDPCPEEDDNNFQHARYKSVVKDIAAAQQIYFGQILTNSSERAFWDADDDHSRIKQYLLGNYLVAVDNGWILERARYYRGAIQVEDEEAWGQNFFRWLLRDQDQLAKHYFLIAQAARDVPHRGETDVTQRIRAVSRVIADRYPAFMDLRIKIHGRPSGEDAVAVSDFMAVHRDKLSELDLLDDAELLIKDIQQTYGGNGLKRIEALSKLLQLRAPEVNLVREKLENFLTDQQNTGTIDRLTAAAELSLFLREQLANNSAITSTDRMYLVDVNNELSDLVFREAPQWEPGHARERMEKICYLSQAAAGAGLVELWEFAEASQQLADLNYQYIFPATMATYVDNARRLVEWGTATNRATFGAVVDRYAAFEPKAYGFLDSRIRASVLLPLGEEVGELGAWLANHQDQGNALMDLPNQAQARGLNPGFAWGVLRVIDGNPESVEVNPDDIFVFSRPPADLKPVGGILTVSEGNMVSHVQLLARNLGIPNAVLTSEQFGALSQYDGLEVFYAVSNAGTVLMKPSTEMSPAEQELFAERERSQERIAVPVDRIDLNTRSVLNLREVSSADSGVRCGPKAANLGQLKRLFPDKVVEGLVIPFGIFRDHLDQPMPGQSGISYWSYLNEGFTEAKQMTDNGAEESSVEAFTLDRLATLREAIAKIKISPALVAELEEGFRSVLGDDLGKVPVFLRSDTNMEDLADFTGAGLNKTVFNAVDRDRIIRGIKEVWASPYTERSYRWRQRYLLNPENVFPSILIIPTVDVEYSGVVITKGITSGHPEDVTVAFSRGAGGAVDGQAAESYLLDHAGRFTLLAPARERLHRRLPVTGGSEMLPATFEDRILKRQNLVDLWTLSQDVERVMPTSPGVASEGPFDVELGFQDDKIWLFQIRPFVENDNAMSSEYLESISPTQREGVWLDLEAK
jgi:hypothetical protein